MNRKRIAGNGWREHERLNALSRLESLVERQTRPAEWRRRLWDEVTPSVEQKKCLRTSGSAVESSERSAVAVGRRTSGESRVKEFAPCRRFP